MSRKDQSNIEILLGDWGAWKFRENRCAVGYPSISALARMRVDCSSSKDLPDFVADADVLRLDAIVEAMRPALKRVLVVHYMMGGRTKDKAAMLGRPLRQYHVDLQYATQQAAHEMGGKYLLEWDEKCAV